MALTKQIESNHEQTLKNESDIILLLINQFQNEISSFYFSYYKNDKEMRFNGAQAIDEFTNNISNSKKTYPHGHTFKHSWQSNQILLLKRSYELIEKRISMSVISEDLKSLFLKKMESYFDCRLKEPIVAIKNNLIKIGKDEVSDEVISFFEKHV